MGTANLLDVCRSLHHLRAIVVVTTDKCYENAEWVWPYRENDRLGGKDPYSASKAATELLVSSYRSSYFSTPQGPLLATARAGNVLGGGDWSEDRLIPDLVRASMQGAVLEVRNPRSTRPWQHVLDSIAGYLRLGAKLLQGDRECADAWNFGPVAQQGCSVADVLQRMADYWPALKYRQATGEHPLEAGWLRLDSSKAQARLGFKPVWDIDQTLSMTASWYRQFLESKTIATRTQLDAYLKAAES
jgi:CDP-glucose 4,6-dehydratase